MMLGEFIHFRTNNQTCNGPARNFASLKYTVDDRFSTAILISPRHAIALSTELIDYQWEQHTKKYNNNKWAYEYNFVNNEEEPYDARECKNK